MAGAVVAVCHGQVCGGVGDSQPSEEGLICDHPRLILRLSVLVAGASSSIILLLFSVPVTLVVTLIVVIAMVVTLVITLVVVVAVVVTLVITLIVVVTLVVTLVVAVAPPLLLWLCVTLSSPVFLWLLVVAPSPLCHIKTFLFILSLLAAVGFLAVSSRLVRM